MKGKDVCKKIQQHMEDKHRGYALDAQIWEDEDGFYFFDDHDYRTFVVSYDKEGITFHYTFPLWLTSLIVKYYEKKT